MNSAHFLQASGTRWLAAAVLCCLLLCMAVAYQLYTGQGDINWIRQEPASGNSVIMNRQGTQLYTANGDANTVSVVDLKSLRVIAEMPVGKNPQQLALSADEQKLFVTSRYTNSVETLDLTANTIIRSTPVGIEPYGAVTSPDGSLLYVTNDRSSTISVIDTKSSQVTATIQLDERPRALSVTADGKRLYIAHYLSGRISEIDTAALQVARTLLLSPSPDLDNPKKSQGIPNSLEQIRISPDGKAAWVSHLLMNIDTPVNFEETIFPAISVIDLEKFSEKPKERKELFNAINVRNVRNETNIVANPSDLIFSKDGKKLYSLMAGSEDLVVFDIQRGGKASQLLRHIPGNLPVSAVLSNDGEKLYIRNAMSHDLAIVDTGAQTEYAEAKVIGATLPLISHDPLPPEVRKGKTIFYSANSDEFPITQNQWMSCASCHANGEVNGLNLMTNKGPRNIPSNVLAMKSGLFMWDGSRDDFSDYILTVQGEMGGMKDIDPAKPLPMETQDILDALQAYMQSPDAFPVPQSPFKQPNGTLNESQRQGKALFEGKARCITCHATDLFTDSGKATDAQGKLNVLITDFLHDVGTGTSADLASEGDARAQFANPRSPDQYDTPTLRGVWATAPYLHDGSAATLHDVLVSRNSTGRHGSTSELSDIEMNQLVDYLKTLD